MRSIPFALASILLSVATAYADPAPPVPLELPVSVHIARDGVPANETLPVRFSIYSAATSGTELWHGAAHDVVVKDGFTTQFLGLDADNPLRADIFNGSVVYLQIVVAGYEMDARIPLRSVPYALRAGTAGLADKATLADRSMLADRSTLADRSARADGAALAESLGLPTTPAGQRVQVDARGFVGLGAAPTERLTVNGNVKVEGTVVANPTYAVTTLNQPFETTSQNFVPVTNAAVTVTTHGKPVLVTVTATYQATQVVPNYLPWGQVGLTRDGGPLGRAGGAMAGASEAQAEWGQDPISFTFVDVEAGAGTHTYQLTFRSGTGTRMRLLDGVTTQIAAIELN